MARQKISLQIDYIRHIDDWLGGRYILCINFNYNKV
jgi:hypothetical protein